LGPGLRRGDNLQVVGLDAEAHLPAGAGELALADVERVLADLHAPALEVARVEHIARADETRDEARARALVDLLGRADLLDLPGVHDDDAIGHRHRLDLVVRHVDRGVAEFLVQPADLEAHVAPEIRVEVRQGLVQEQDVRARGEGAREGHALLLAAGKLGGVALRIVAEARGLQHRVGAALALLGAHFLHLESVRDVLLHGHVRPDRVALENHPHVAPLGRNDCARGGDRLPSHADLAAVGLEEACDHPKRRRLPQPEGPEQAHELAALDRDVDGIHRDDVPETLRQVDQLEMGHQRWRRKSKSTPLSAWVTDSRNNLR
jgi:hypothetical protein